MHTLPPRYNEKERYSDSASTSAPPCLILVCGRSFVFGLVPNPYNDHRLLGGSISRFSYFDPKGEWGGGCGELGRC